MIIRPARIDEVDALADLGLSFLQTTAYPSLEYATADTIGALLMAAFGLGEEACILVADDGGVLFGGIVVVDQVHPVTLRHFADEVGWWVEPSYAGFRAGPKLLRAAEAWALVKGLEMIKMVAPIGSLSVGRFYLRHGYRPVETSYYKRLG